MPSLTSCAPMPSLVASRTAEWIGTTSFKSLTKAPNQSKVLTKQDCDTAGLPGLRCCFVLEIVLVCGIDMCITNTCAIGQALRCYKGKLALWQTLVT